MNRALNHYYKQSAPQIWMNKSVGVPLHRDMQLDESMTVHVNPLRRFIPANQMMHWDNIHCTRGFVPLHQSHPIYLINLDVRIDRLNEWTYHWNKHLNGPAFHVQRMPAIKHRHGWIGCALSQLKCVVDAKERRLPLCIIMEDDCAPLTRHFYAAFSKTIKWLESHLDDWDIWNGMPANMVPNKPMIPISRGHGIYSCNGGVNHHLVVINSRCYDRLIKLIDLYLQPDAHEHRGALCIDEITNRHFKMITTYPFLVSTYSDCSNIDDGATVDAASKMQYLDPPRDIPWYDLSDITVCITAAPGRRTNLQRTLYSLKEIKARGARLVVNTCDDHYNNMKTLYKPGQIDTMYVLHCEDDWTFTDNAVECLLVAKEMLKCFGQVWLRDINDLMGHPVDYHLINGYHCFVPKPYYNGIYNGFTLNPSLMLTKTMEYKVGQLDEHMPSAEMEIKMNEGWYEKTTCLPVGCVWHNGELSTKDSYYQQVCQKLVE